MTGSLSTYHGHSEARISSTGQVLKAVGKSAITAVVALPRLHKTCAQPGLQRPCSACFTCTPPFNPHSGYHGSVPCVYEREDDDPVDCLCLQVVGQVVWMLHAVVCHNSVNYALYSQEVKSLLIVKYPCLIWWGREEGGFQLLTLGGTILLPSGRGDLQICFACVLCHASPDLLPLRR